MFSQRARCGGEAMPCVAVNVHALRRSQDLQMHLLVLALVGACTWWCLHLAVLRGLACVGRHRECRRSPGQHCTSPCALNRLPLPSPPLCKHAPHAPSRSVHAPPLSIWRHPVPGGHHRPEVHHLCELPHQPHRRRLRLPGQPAARPLRHEEHPLRHMGSGVYRCVEGGFQRQPTLSPQTLEPSILPCSGYRLPAEFRYMLTSRPPQGSHDHKHAINRHIKPTYPRPD